MSDISIEQEEATNVQDYENMLGITEDRCGSINDVECKVKQDETVCTVQDDEVDSNTDVPELTLKLNTLNVFYDNHFSNMTGLLRDYSIGMFGEPYFNPAMGFGSLHLNTSLDTLSSVYLYQVLFKNLDKALEILVKSEPKNTSYYTMLTSKVTKFSNYLTEFQSLYGLILKIGDIPVPIIPKNLQSFSEANLDLITTEFLNNPIGKQFLKSQNKTEKQILVPLRNYVILRCYIGALKDFYKLLEKIRDHFPHS